MKDRNKYRTLLWTSHFQIHQNKKSYLSSRRKSVTKNFYTLYDQIQRQTLQFHPVPVAFIKNEKPSACEKIRKSSIKPSTFTPSSIVNQLFSGV